MRVSRPGLIVPRLTASSSTPDQSRQVIALRPILAFLRRRQRLGIAQQGEELSPAPEEYDGVARDGGDLRANRAASRQRRANFALQFREPIDYRGPVELLFRFELTVNAALADAGARGDLVDQHQIEFPFGEEFGGASEYPFTQERRGRPAAAVFAANRR